jgi:hypothetical protein
MKKAQDAWRKKGPIGKMHNIITWIRCTSQRREAFIRTVVGEEGDGKSLQLSKTSIYETSASWPEIISDEAECHFKWSGYSALRSLVGMKFFHVRRGTEMNS